ncbi:hypothetical protein [Serinibacter salmoneus]|uniref:hypothetical protein n=1 Tax=Serinibacter salmoneus TaxID=556530 RepID=UPI000BF60B83|nr:hypothetical protein [Serinibacter salmoneus]
MESDLASEAAVAPVTDVSVWRLRADGAPERTALTGWSRSGPGLLAVDTSEAASEYTWLTTAGRMLTVAAGQDEVRELAGLEVPAPASLDLHLALVEDEGRVVDRVADRLRVQSMRVGDGEIELGAEALLDHRPRAICTSRRYSSPGHERAQGAAPCPG